MWENMGRHLELWSPPVLWNFSPRQAQNPKKKLLKCLKKVCHHPGISKETQIAGTCLVLAYVYQVSINTTPKPVRDPAATPAPVTGPAASPTPVIVPVATPTPVTSPAAPQTPARGPSNSSERPYIHKDEPCSHFNTYYTPCRHSNLLSQPLQSLQYL